jgi:hypothetical protein
MVATRSAKFWRTLCAWHQPGYCAQPIGAVEHVQYQAHLTAVVRHDAHVAQASEGSFRSGLEMRASSQPSS